MKRKWKRSHWKEILTEHLLQILPPFHRVLWLDGQVHLLYHQYELLHLNCLITYTVNPQIFNVLLTFQFALEYLKMSNASFHINWSSSQLRFDDILLISITFLLDWLNFTHLMLNIIYMLHNIWYYKIMYIFDGFWQRNFLWVIGDSKLDFPVLEIWIFYGMGVEAIQCLLFLLCLQVSLVF